MSEKTTTELALRQRNAELKTLNEIGQALSRLTERMDVVERVLTAVGRVLDNRNFSIAFIDRKRQRMLFPVYTIRGERLTRNERPIANGITEYVLRTNAPLLVRRDVERAVRDRGLDLIGQPSRSLVAVPLRSGDEAIGVLALEDYDQEDAYDQHHVELLTTIAAQAGGALENSRLYTALQQELEERRRAEAALRGSEARYRSLVENSADVIGIYQDETLVFVNSAGAQLVGAASPAELLNQRVERLVHPDEIPAGRDRLRRCLAGEKGIYPVETRYLHLDGTPIPVEVTVSLTEFQGRPAFQFMARDIRERKRAEAALRESLFFRREAEKIARIGAWKANPERNTMSCSEGVYEILRIPADYRPSLSEGLKFFDPGAVPAVQAALQSAWRDNTPFTLVADVTTQCGRHLWAEVRGLGCLGEGGERHVIGTFQDISERKQLEEQFRQAQKLQAVGQLAGGVAHDFNNILAVIMMHIGLLQTNSSVDDGIHQALKELEASARRAAALTRQLLMLSRRSVLAIKPLDLNELVVNLLKMLSRLIGEHIDLRFDGKTGLPALEADAGMLDQVLINLVVNARDAMPNSGRITIATSALEFGAEETAAHPERRTGRFVCLAVSDTGTGMDAGTLARLFEPFFTTKEPGKGTGLGLATVHGIVAQHKGWVEVESRVGQGTTFRVFLPALTQTTAEAVPPPLAETLQCGRESILLAEDDPKVRQSVGEVLRTLGYRVYEAANGQEAMPLWQAHGAEIDLLITDMVMPEGITGLELAERLQRLKPGLKVIISSGYSAEIVQAGLPSEAGVVYLPKPFTTQMLARVVRSCLDPPGV